MILSGNNLDRIKNSGIEIPGKDYFSLPEKVLQFGTGGLLRGLPDYFIDQANKQGLFNGRIVVVKSTDSGSADGFKDQDNLYTICIRGVEGDQKVERNIINASVSRVLSARDHWDEILRCAESPEMQIVISNTTEVGIVLTDDWIEQTPPTSFPGKLLAFLYHRFRFFQGDLSRGMIIIPTELILNNADQLFSILVQLAEKQPLEPAFIEWLEKANFFCNSLVDCIVPGKLSAAAKSDMETRLGYSDELLIMTEVYRLWAIQSSSPKVKEALSFAQADNGVVIAPDIQQFRELKLRLLNGSHTFNCALAVVFGYSLVRQALDAPLFIQYLRELMLNEIIPVIAEGDITKDSATDFAQQVIDRFKNPFIDHAWMAISLQYSTKMRMRNVPLILKYADKFGEAPPCMSLGFAAYLLFMKSEKKADGKYYGSLSGMEYLIQDDQASYFYLQWKLYDTHHFVAEVLQNQDLWGTDLSSLKGFAEAVHGSLLLLQEDPQTALQQVMNKKIENEK